MLRQHQIDMGLPPRASIAVPMPRIDIADYTALTPEAISRAFADLERRDYIMVARDRSVAITDEAAFAALVSGDVARPHAIAAG